MSSPRQPTAQEIFNALDIMHSAPSPFGMEHFVRAIKKDCDGFRDKIESKLFGDESAKLSDQT